MVSRNAKFLMNKMNRVILNTPNKKTAYKHICKIKNPKTGRYLNPEFVKKYIDAKYKQYLS